MDTLLNVAVEHRLMHVETLAYMLHQLALDKKVRQDVHRISTTLRWSTGWLRSLRVWRHSAFAVAPKTSVGTMSMKLTPWTSLHLRLISTK